jgi:hypothetical protein
MITQQRYNKDAHKVNVIQTFVVLFFVNLSSIREHNENKFHYFHIYYTIIKRIKQKKKKLAINICPRK